MEPNKKIQGMKEDITQALKLSTENGWITLVEIMKLPTWFWEIQSKNFSRFESSKLWTMISGRQILDEDFMRKFKDKIDWREVSLHQKLSEPFMHEFTDRLDWNRLIRFQEMSEAFIEQHADHIDFQRLSAYRDLSTWFVTKYNDKLDHHLIKIKNKSKKAK